MDYDGKNIQYFKIKKIYFQWFLIINGDLIGIQFYKIIETDINRIIELIQF